MILYLHRRDRARPCPNLIYITSDSRKGCPYGFYQIEMFAEPSLPLTRKVARRRRDGRREAVNIKFSLSLPQSNAGRLTAPSSEGAYVYAKFSISYKPKAIINTQIFSAGASPRPTETATHDPYGRPAVARQIQSELKAGEHSSPLRHTIYFSNCAIRFYYTTFNFSFFTFHSYLGS